MVSIQCSTYGTPLSAASGSSASNFDSKKIITNSLAFPLDPISRFTVGAVCTAYHKLYTYINVSIEVKFLVTGPSLKNHSFAQLSNSFCLIRNSMVYIFDSGCAEIDAKVLELFSRGCSCSSRLQIIIC